MTGRSNARTNKLSLEISFSLPHLSQSDCGQHYAAGYILRTTSTSYKGKEG